MDDGQVRHPNACCRVRATPTPGPFLRASRVAVSLWLSSSSAGAVRLAPVLACSSGNVHVPVPAPSRSCTAHFGARNQYRQKHAAAAVAACLALRWPQSMPARVTNGGTDQTCMSCNQTKSNSREQRTENAAGCESIDGWLWRNCTRYAHCHCKICQQALSTGCSISAGVYRVHVLLGPCTSHWAQPLSHRLRASRPLPSGMLPL
ncbi:hypothetical protein J3F83DRAFT_677157 [Trichoderma novae-zelandiae]